MGEGVSKMLMHGSGGWGGVSLVMADANEFFLQISGFSLIYTNVNNF